MSDITTKQIEIVLKGRDDGTLNLLWQAERRVSSLAQSLRQGGDIGELSGLKKLGKNVGEFMGLGDRSSSIRDNADSMRLEAAAKLREEYQKLNGELETGRATELRTSKILDLKQQAAEKYKKTIKEINDAEASAIKSSGSGSGLVRGLAVAGGTLAAIQAAGKIAEAWDAANQKLEEGKIAAGEWTAEFAKGLPLIGGVVKSAATLLMVVTGTASQLREANREAAELDKKIASQNATRKAAGELGAELGSLNLTDRQKVMQDAADRFAKIKKLRDEANANGTIGQLEGGFKKDEAEVIKKRERDLGEIEARERRERAQKVKEVEDQIAEGQRSVYEQQTKQRIADLKEQGKEEEAAKMEINLQADARRAELLQKRKALDSQLGLSDDQRIALNGSIDEQLQANERTRQAQLGAAGREAAKRAADALKDKEKEMLDRQIAAVNAQRAARTSNFDGREQAGFFNQGKEVTLASINQKTADNTSKTNDKLDKLITTLEQFKAAGGLLSL